MGTRSGVTTTEAPQVRSLAGDRSRNARVRLGAVCEVLLIIANIGAAVVVYPIFRRQYEALSLGYVTARLAECTFIAIGIVSYLAVVTSHQTTAGVAGGSLLNDARSLVAVCNWTFVHRQGVQPISDARGRSADLPGERGSLSLTMALGQSPGGVLAPSVVALLGRCKWRLPRRSARVLPIAPRPMPAA